MKVYCGTDIIEINRIKNSIENTGAKFLNKVFTKKEIEYCESKNKQKYEHYAGRFAAKEAVFKAVSKILNDKYSVTWKDIEILNDIQGRPYVSLLNVDMEKIENIDISISHCKEYATANAVVMIKTKIK